MRVGRLDWCPDHKVEQVPGFRLRSGPFRVFHTLLTSWPVPTVMQDDGSLEDEDEWKLQVLCGEDGAAPCQPKRRPAAAGCAQRAPGIRVGVRQTMEVGAPMDGHLAALAVAAVVPSSSRVNPELRSIADCVAVALEQVRFTPGEIEGVLGLDGESWQ